jgi:methanogenic corrinoid protein MtbC1
LNKLGSNIKYLRKENNYSQIELANAVGVSQTSIAHYERGTRLPSIETLMDFSQIFDEPIDTLVGNSYKSTSKQKKKKLNKDDLISKMVETLLIKDEEEFTTLINQSLTPYYDIYKMVDSIFKEVMYEIGDLWEKGSISEADEHYASNLVSKVFHSISSTNENLLKTKKAISFTVGSEKHTLGIEMVNACLQAEGVDTLYLGSDLPIRSIEKVIKENNVNYIFISITMSESMNSLIHMVDYIVEKFNGEIEIVIGGQGLRKDKKLLQHKNVRYIKNIHDLLEFLH